MLGAPRQGEMQMFKQKFECRCSCSFRDSTVERFDTIRIITITYANVNNNCIKIISPILILRNRRE